MGTEAAPFWPPSMPWWARAIEVALLAALVSVFVWAPLVLRACNPVAYEAAMAPRSDPDPCCECEADLAECEWDRAAWREQAVRCVDDVLEVKAR